MQGDAPDLPEPRLVPTIVLNPALAGGAAAAAAAAARAAAPPAPAGRPAAATRARLLLVAEGALRRPSSWTDLGAQLAPPGRLPGAPPAAPSAAAPTTATTTTTTATAAPAAMTNAARRSVPAAEWSARLEAVRASRADADRLVMDWLVTEGHAAAARAFAAEAGADPGADLDAAAAREGVRRAAAAGDVEAAVEAVNDLDPDVLEERPELVFRLQQQRLIELVRGGATAEALAYARARLAPRGEDAPALLEELERTVALLLFEDPAASPLGALLDPAQRRRAARELNAAVLQAQGRPREARLPALLKLLDWLQAQLEEAADAPRLDLEARLAAGGAGGGEGGAADMETDAPAAEGATA
jgi:hypothetical protein